MLGRLGHEIGKVFRRLGYHFCHFWPVVFVLALLLIASLFSLGGDWGTYKFLATIALLGIILLLCLKPLNAVYGLMGTSGSISIFFINLIVLCFLFSFVYYWGFFKTAGISYDVNQPHISYGMFEDSPETSPKIQIQNLWIKPSLRREVQQNKSDDINTVIVYASDGVTIKDTIIQRISSVEVLTYQNIDYTTVLRNTALTFLMQEPTELFAAASTYNSDMSGEGRTIDKQKTEHFHWILILQVLIGWIFFGVFISILYNKFRYES